MMLDNMVSNRHSDVAPLSHDFEILPMFCIVVHSMWLPLPVLWSCDWPSYILVG